VEDHVSAVFLSFPREMANKEIPSSSRRVRG
jgi:hypothetical protein